MNTARSAIHSSLLLMGNASAHFNVERTKAIMKHLNTDTKLLAEAEFPDGSPYLFGEDFGKRAKANADDVRALKGIQSKKGNRFFQERRLKQEDKVYVPESPSELGHQVLVSEISVQQTDQALPVRPRSIIQEVLQTSKTSLQVTNFPSINSLSQQSLPLKLWIAVVTHPCALSVDSDSFQAVNLRPPVATEILAGRTQLHLGNWRKITSDQWVLEVIQGYKLELTSLPEQLWIPSSETDRISAGLISEEVQAMLDKGAICRIQRNPEEGFFSRIFLVPKKDGKFRPVVNLRPLNRCIQYRHFKMEGIHIVRDLLR